MFHFRSSSMFFSVRIGIFLEIYFCCMSDAGKLIWVSAARWFIDVRRSIRRFMFRLAFRVSSIAFYSIWISSQQNQLIISQFCFSLFYSKWQEYGQRNVHNAAGPCICARFSSFYRRRVRKRSTMMTTKIFGSFHIKVSRLHSEHPTDEISKWRQTVNANDRQAEKTGETDARSTHHDVIVVVSFFASRVYS